eukprot:scaffold13189_cov103-Isochrysis_galbana.AAC.3
MRAPSRERPDESVLKSVWLMTTMSAGGRQPPLPSRLPSTRSRKPRHSDGVAESTIDSVERR